MSAVLFTRENAREKSAKGNQVRWSRWREAKLAEKQRKEAAANPVFVHSANPDEMRECTIQQLKRLDAMINQALDSSDAKAFLTLSKSKCDLWKLVQPTAGVMRPGRQSRRSQVDAQPVQPIATPQGNLQQIKDSSENKPVRDMSQEM